MKLNPLAERKKQLLLCLFFQQKAFSDLKPYLKDL